MYFMCDSVRLKCSVSVQVLSCIEKQWILGKIAFNFKNTEYFETFNKNGGFWRGSIPKNQLVLLGIWAKPALAWHLKILMPRICIIHHTPNRENEKHHTSNTNSLNLKLFKYYKTCYIIL